ncbi:MAG: glycogen synthase GlgA [Candidatus Binatia bacterium]|nr:glycogen synthase GlgA [Candidatus Binatia bacterium]
MAAAEVAPFARTGGLGDVLGALPRFLKRCGVDVAVVLPGYRCTRVPQFGWEGTDFEVQAPVSSRFVRAPVLRTTMGDEVPVYAIAADEYFDRPALYGEGGKPYPDNAERFAFFSRAVLDLAGTLGIPDVIHVHDWHAALASAFLRADAARYPWSQQVRTVLTIHNLAYQGSFWAHDWYILNLDPRFFSFDALEAWGNINYLKGGISFADWITTVSPTYAREIQTPEYGCGLDGTLRYRAERLTGILNGVDYDEWDPATDPNLPANFSLKDLRGKAGCKAHLQQRLGLPVNPHQPLIGVVSRLVAEKGMALLADTMPALLETGVQLVLLGQGDVTLERRWQEIGQRYKGAVSVNLAFDERLARQIYGGTDIFLMPSQFEPCGLSQMYAMRYGSIPVVHATGGLLDSVIDVQVDPEHATGFHFSPFTSAALVSAVDRALQWYAQPPLWRALVERAMRADFSWGRAAAAYQNVYANARTSDPFWPLASH